MRIFAFSLLLLFATACEPPHLDPATNPAVELPLLSAGPQIGLIQGFNADNSPAIQDSISQRMEEAYTKGMKIARIQVDWSELEPSRGIYDLTDLREELEANHAAGRETMLTLSSLDSDAYTIPEDLLEESFSGAVLLDRYKALMDEIVPLMRANGGWLITIANEPDTHFEENPDLWKEVRDMVKEMRDYIHQLDPDMAVTITLTEGGFASGVKGIRQIVEECDVICFNYYGQGLLGALDSPDEVREDLDRILRAFPKMPLVIQELGCSAGYESGSNMEGANLENQRLFFETVFSYMENEPRFRAAVVFQLVDWSPATSGIFRQDLLDGGVDEDFVNVFLESLETLGLIRFKDGTTKPAWDEFLRWVERFAA